MTTHDQAPGLTGPSNPASRRWYRQPGGIMIITGCCAAIAGFLTLHTTLLLAYKAGNLATVHAMCTSGLGQFAQGLSTRAASNCQDADSWYTLSLAAMWGGIALAVGGFVVLTSRMSRR